MNKSEIRQKIVDSFCYDVTFSCEDIVDINHTYEEYEGNAVGLFFEGKVNGELGLYDLIDNYQHDYKACLAFMKPEADAYFLGSYLIWSLDDDIYGPEITDILLDRFDCSEDAQPVTYNKIIKVVKCLNSAQRSTVHDYFRFFQTKHADHYPFNDFDKIYLMLGG